MVESAALVILAKTPKPGVAKTRLAQTVGARGAAALAGAFLLDLLARTRTLPVERLVGCWPSASDSGFRRLGVQTGVRCFTQRGRTLGDRMAHAMAFALRRGARRVVLLGTDSPTVPVAHLRRAYRLLARAPQGYHVVLGPADDGGYYLVGVRDRAPDIFHGIAWGTDRVFAQTLDRAAALGLRMAVLPAWYDVDTEDDLERLVAQLRGRTARGLSATRQVLRTLGLL